MPSNAEGESARKTRSKRTKKDNQTITEKLETVFPALVALLPREERDDDDLFETLFALYLPDYLTIRAKRLNSRGEVDEMGHTIRPLTKYEMISFIRSRDINSTTNLSEIIATRKLKLHQERLIANLPSTPIHAPNSETISPLPRLTPTPAPKPEVLSALSAIRTTPYQNSFLARLGGADLPQRPKVLTLDWETISPWMSVMDDVRAHHALSHPDRMQPEETIAPIVYTTLEPLHLPQVHELLSRAFWAGIDVSDALDYSPEKCTVVVTYKNLVVGAAFLSSPQETYITYLAVRSGWDNAQIATTMLYHLIVLNPNRDISLHVSANNPAMLLYNRFGFKAEEFIAGFYQDYLDAQSRQSKNAFRLRLRR